jgi:ATP-dependent RNA helicase DDX41
MPLVKGEGPVAIIMAPARELARQTYENVCHFTEALAADPLRRYPTLRVMLAIGGDGSNTQMDAARAGVHIVVATPGRLKDHLARKRLNLDLCRFISLDEGDQMLDTGFDADMEEIFSYFKHQRQTVIFSATMAPKIESFAKAALVKPVVVNVSRAGAASLNIVQDVEFVKPEARALQLLSSLQKTAPPVLVFAENKRDVEDVAEYLLLKGVSAVAIHGSMSQVC